MLASYWNCEVELAFCWLGIVSNVVVAIGIVVGWIRGQLEPPGWPSYRGNAGEILIEFWKELVLKVIKKLCKFLMYSIMLFVDFDCSRR